MLRPLPATASCWEPLSLANVISMCKQVSEATLIRYKLTSLSLPREPAVQVQVYAGDQRRWHGEFSRAWSLLTCPSPFPALSPPADLSTVQGLLLAWGPRGSSLLPDRLAADLNCDGHVDLSDLLILFDNWTD